MGISEQNSPDEAGTNVVEKLKTALTENMDQLVRDPGAIVGDLAMQAVNRAAGFVADAAKKTVDKLVSAGEPAPQAPSAEADGQETDPETEGEAEEAHFRSCSARWKRIDFNLYLQLARCAPAPWRLIENSQQAHHRPLFAGT